MNNSERSIREEEPYYYSSELDEKEGDCDGLYQTLRGPDGEVCTLTEPEDRIWWRDLAPVIELLNRQHGRIKQLECELVRLMKEREEVINPFSCYSIPKDLQMRVLELDLKEADLIVLRVDRLDPAMTSLHIKTAFEHKWNEMFKHYGIKGPVVICYKNESVEAITNAVIEGLNNAVDKMEKELKMVLAVKKMRELVENAVKETYGNEHTD